MAKNSDIGAIAAGYAYVSTYKPSPGIAIVDLKEPTQPQVVGSHATSEKPRSLCVDEGTLYAFVWKSGVQVLDISQPDSPVFLSMLDDTVVSGNVFASDGVAYVTDSTSKAFKTYDVSTPASPAELGQCELPGKLTDLWVISGHAYVGADTTGIYVVDVTEPAQPKFVGISGVAGQVTDVYVYENTLFASTLKAGVKLVDLSDPAAPKYGTECDTKVLKQSSQVRFANGYALVAASSGGVQTWDVSTCLF